MTKTNSSDIDVIFNKQTIPLKDTDYSVLVEGGLAIVTTTRTFRNEEKKSIEATMTFPVPVQACLVSLEAEIDDRKLVGTAKAKVEARNTYEAAIDEGKTSLLHEELLSGIHMLSVGHVAPSKTVKVKTVWVSPLSLQGEGKAALRIPTTVGQIYGESGLSECDDILIANVEYNATLSMEGKDCALQLLSHNRDEGNDGTTKVTLDMPIDILVTNMSNQEALNGYDADGRKVTLDIDPIESKNKASDMIILCDVSFSMESSISSMPNILNSYSLSQHSEKHTSSKWQFMIDGLKDAAEHLRNKDTISLWEFSCQRRKVGTSLGGEEFQSIVHGISSPHGGTEIGLALEDTIGSSETENILILTDGQSFNLNVQKLLKTGRRFSVVLIGESSFDCKISQLAALSGGQVFISLNGEIASCIASAINGFRSEHKISAPLAKVPKAAEFQRGGFQIKAKWGAKSKKQPSDIEKYIGSFASHLLLPKLDREVATSFAEKNGLVCHLTSLVIVDEASEKQNVLPSQRKVPLSTSRVTRNMSFQTSGPMAASSVSNRLSADASSMSYIRNMITGSNEVSEYQWNDNSIYGHNTQAPNTGFLEIEDYMESNDFIKLMQSSRRSKAWAINWAKEPEKLKNGLVDHLPLNYRAAIQDAGQHEFIKKVAADFGIDPMRLAVGLFAREASSDRNAKRIARAILKGIPEKIINEAIDKIKMENAILA